MSIGALVTNSHLAAHPLIRARYPVLAEAICTAPPDRFAIWRRQVATHAAHALLLLYDTHARCNKRAPGTGCDALEGFNRMHAILGASEACIATHPSDMCVALAALDATVQVTGANGKRAIPLVDFHRLPEDTPQTDTNLQPDELITAVELPALLRAPLQVSQVRDRASYAFALVSVAAALEVEDGTIKQARLALGGVAHKPWRAFAAEKILVGAPAVKTPSKRQQRKNSKWHVATSTAAFKIELARRTMMSVLTTLANEGGAR